MVRPATWRSGGASDARDAVARARRGEQTRLPSRVDVYDWLKPLLFALDPRHAHALAGVSLRALGAIPGLDDAVRGRMAAPDPRLAVEAMGLSFPGPVGLAGGFDKNATMARGLATIGFGFLELGTVTARAQEPNPAPNLFRLPEDEALINRLGFPNDGAEVVAARLARLADLRSKLPVGVSIGKSRAVPLEPIAGAVADYVESYSRVSPHADFVVVNVSSPNTKGLRALQGASLLRELLGAIVAAQGDEAPRRPLLLKIAPDLDDDDVLAACDVVSELGAAGVVAANTTVKRAGLRTAKATIDAIGAGGLSGPPLFDRALELVGAIRKRLGPEKTVIGVGGISSVADAEAMLAAGATLVQIYTRFVYGGPSAARALHRGLAARIDEVGASDLAGLVAAQRAHGA